MISCLERSLQLTRKETDLSYNNTQIIILPLANSLLSGWDSGLLGAL
jgi:hypothetical protein